MVILHLLAPAHVGGLERVVQSLAVGQQQQGHRVAVATILQRADDAGAFFEPLARAGIAIHRIVVPGRGYLDERRQVRALVRSLSPDVVHSHGYRPDVIDSGTIRRIGVATVATAHGYTGGSLRNRLYESLHRRAFRRFDAVIAVSAPLGERLRRSGVPAARTHVVPNAFVQIVEPLDRASARRELALPAEAFVVGWVGRMNAAKGLDVLVDALPHLRDMDLLVCAIGDGPDRAVETAKLERLELGDRVRWAGMVPEASRFFPAFDLYAISSRTEGLPITLLEAMASGVPVVTTRVGGIPDAVSADEAILVEPQQPAALAQAIRSVQENRGSAAARAGRARARLASEFGTASWIAAHLAVYESAIRVRAGSA